MELELLQHWLESGMGFRILVLLSVAGSYVLFEMLMSLKTRMVGAPQQATYAPLQTQDQVAHAYRSVSGWSALPEID